MSNSKALFTGSFDPLTSGHLDLIKRAAGIFDEVVVGVIINYSKTPYFTIEERVSMIEKVVEDMPNVRVDSFTGLLADYVNANGFNVILRGLRGAVDFDYEMQMASMNDHLFNEGIETVFMMADPKYSFISSSLAKEVHSLFGDITGLVPESILEEMNKKRGIGA